MTYELTVFIPALNEQERLGATVCNVIRAGREASNLALDVLIIDDGSVDRTLEIAERLSRSNENVRVIHHATNLGLGISVRQAITAAWGGKFVIVPGDDDMSYELILSMFENCHQADMVLCFYVNREMRGRFRSTISAVYGVIYMAVFNVFVQYINSPCIYPTTVLREVNLISSRFSIAAEMTIKLLKRGVTFFEVPGYMQTGAKNSSSLNLRSLREAMGTFLRLVLEINWVRRSEYAERPVRRLIPLYARPATPAQRES